MTNLMNPKRRTVPPLHRPIPTVLNLKPGGAILKSFDYQRDANGMVTSVEREDPCWNQTYLYDNRLQRRNDGNQRMSLRRGHSDEGACVREIGSRR